MKRSDKKTLVPAPVNGRPAKKRSANGRATVTPPSRFYGAPLPGVKPEELSGTLVVIIQYALLKNAEALRSIKRNSEVHSGFIIFKLGASSEDAIYSYVERSAKIKRDVRSRGKTVKIPQPVG